MTAEERIAELEQENEQLRAELAEAHQQIAQLAERLQLVEGRLVVLPSLLPSFHCDANMFLSSQQ